MATDENYNYKRIYTGSEVNVKFLQELLEKEGVSTRIRNDFDSGLRAGFGGGMRGQVLLFAEDAHYEKAVKTARETFPEDFRNEENADEKQ